MSKYVQFTVELEFSEEIISDNEMMEIAQNIAEAVENRGIAPEDSDAYTVAVRVTPQFLNKTVHIDIAEKMYNTPIGVIDVKTVAESLKIELSDAEIATIIESYKDAEANDPTSNWVEIVEELIYSIKR